MDEATRCRPYTSLANFISLALWCKSKTGSLVQAGANINIKRSEVIFEEVFRLQKIATLLEPKFGVNRLPY